MSPPDGDGEVDTAALAAEEDAEAWVCVCPTCGRVWVDPEAPPISCSTDHEPMAVDHYPPESLT